MSDNRRQDIENSIDSAVKIPRTLSLNNNDPDPLERCRLVDKRINPADYRENGMNPLVYAFTKAVIHKTSSSWGNLDAGEKAALRGDGISMKALPDETGTEEGRFDSAKCRLLAKKRKDGTWDVLREVVVTTHAMSGRYPEDSHTTYTDLLQPRLSVKDAKAVLKAFDAKHLAYENAARLSLGVKPMTRARGGNAGGGPA